MVFWKQPITTAKYVFSRYDWSKCYNSSFRKSVHGVAPKFFIFHFAINSFMKNSEKGNFQKSLFDKWLVKLIDADQTRGQPANMHPKPLGIFNNKNK